MDGQMLEQFLFDIDRSQRWLSQKLGVTSMTVCLWIKNNQKINKKYIDDIMKTLNEEINTLQSNEWWIEGLVRHERDNDESGLD